MLSREWLMMLKHLLDSLIITGLTVSCGRLRPVEWADDDETEALALLSADYDIAWLCVRDPVWSSTGVAHASVGSLGCAGAVAIREVTTWGAVLRGDRTWAAAVFWTRLACRATQRGIRTEVCSWVWEPFPNVQINVKGIKLYVCTNKVNLKELLALNLTYLSLVWSEFLKVEWTAQLEDKRKKLSKADEKDLQVTSWTKKKNLLGNLCQNWWNYEQRKVLSALNHLESI